MSDTVQTTDCDVLIIGGGLAACMAALEASKRNMDVVLVDKGRLGRSGLQPHLRRRAPGGLRPRRPPRQQGPALPGHHPRRRLTSPTRRSSVPSSTRSPTGSSSWRRWGCTSRKPPTASSSTRRSASAAPTPRSCPPVGGSVGMLGLAPQGGLQPRSPGAPVDHGDEAPAPERPGHRSLRHQRPRKAPTRRTVPGAVVLAAGSAIGIQKYTSANFLTTGDAYVAAFDIGAPLANLEFLEFTLIPAPGGEAISMAGLSPFTSKGGRFFNALNERFLEKYDPRAAGGHHARPSSWAPPTRRCSKAAARFTSIRPTSRTRSGTTRSSSSTPPSSARPASTPAPTASNGCRRCIPSWAAST